MKNTLFYMIPCLGSCMLVVDFATISTGTRQKVSVTTTSTEKIVAKYDGKVVVLPNQLDLKCSSDTVISITEPDNLCFIYLQNYTVHGRERINSGVLGNLITGDFYRFHVREYVGVKSKLLYSRYQKALLQHSSTAYTPTAVLASPAAAILSTILIGWAANL